MDPNSPGRISLAYRELTELPAGWNSKYDDITVLDLSHNNFTYPFCNLTLDYAVGTFLKVYLSTCFMVLMMSAKQIDLNSNWNLIEAMFHPKERRVGDAGSPRCKNL